MPEETKGGGGKETPAGTPPVAPGTQTPETKQATQTQTDPNAGKSFTQAELDQAVTRALETRERNLKAEFEAKSAEEKGEFKKLYESEKQRNARLELDRETSKLLADSGLTNLSSVFEAEVSTLDGRKAAVKSLKAAIETEVEKRVADKLKTTTPPKGAADGAGKKVSEMTPEEYKVHRETLGIR